jgi:hypothetical protein
MSSLACVRFDPLLQVFVDFRWTDARLAKQVVNRTDCKMFILKDARSGQPPIWTPGQDKTVKQNIYKKTRTELFGDQLRQLGSRGKGK